MKGAKKMIRYEGQITMGNSFHKVYVALLFGRMCLGVAVNSKGFLWFKEFYNRKGRRGPQRILPKLSLLLQS